MNPSTYEGQAFPKPGPRKKRVLSKKALKSLDGPKSSELVKKLTYWFNRWIRLIDSRPDGWGICITCKKPVSFEAGNACHYIPCTHYGTKWLRENVHLGCVSCNKWKAGNLVAYKEFLEKKYGKGIIQRLEIAKKIHAKRPDVVTLQARIELYKRECGIIENL